MCVNVNKNRLKERSEVELVKSLSMPQ